MKICWAKYVLWTTITIFAVAAMVTSCGQKGPLYLPGDTSSANKYNKTTKQDTKQNKTNKKQEESNKK